MLLNHYYSVPCPSEHSSDHYYPIIYVNSKQVLYKLTTSSSSDGPFFGNLSISMIINIQTWMHSWTDSTTNNPIDIWSGVRQIALFVIAMKYTIRMHCKLQVYISDKQNPKMAYEERRQQSEEITKAVPAQNSRRKRQHLGALPI